ncbi:hypothetical protein ACFV5N_08655 [Streptomyces sp. NPDC059853]|uniref:hypothetical protein n=1 Tax=Streptomyces sp. NPDC059853 TaxID=3346973 RepID=UPI0036536D75
MTVLLRKTPAASAVDLRRLSERQLTGLACSVCGAALRSTDRPRAVGEPVRDRFGYSFALWTCAPVCRRRTPVAPPAPDGAALGCT